MSARRIGLGTEVRVSLSERHGSRKDEEGVITEVVERHQSPRTLRTVHDPCRDQATRYVVQCAGWRTLRLQRDMLVVAR